MASLLESPNGRWRILFLAPCGARKTLRPGKLDRRSAEGLKRHVEALVVARTTGEPTPKPTIAWLADISETLREKLAAVGLIEASQEKRLGEFFRDYILSRPDVKPATKEVWQQPCRNLCEFFGEDTLLKKLTPGDADRFAQWLHTQPLAPATRAKRLTFARTFFHVARKHKLISENPFSEVKIPSASVSKRQRFVDRATVQRLLDVANPTWRTIIALARFGGLRCPSEVLSLEWRHIDWDKNIITVPSPKTSRYDGKGTRKIPLFEELRPFLEEAQELAEPDQTHVVGGNHLAKAQGPNGWKACNLRGSFSKLVQRAGLETWPRLFQNLRSSCETELLESFPIHVVAQWLGHDVKVSLRHYAQVTQVHFERAAGTTKIGAKSGALVAQKQAQHELPVERTKLPEMT